MIWLYSYSQKGWETQNWQGLKWVFSYRARRLDCALRYESLSHFSHQQLCEY